MRHFRPRAKSGFHVLHESDTAQVASMTLKPGETSGELDNEHPESEQWVFVVSGRGIARTSKRRQSIEKGSLVLIERAERHQITNTGSAPLVTLNLYCPPAYTPSGEPR